jgi:hypothetical protein
MMTEVYLYAPEANPNDIILARNGVRPVGLGRRTKAIFIPVPHEVPPVAESLYENLALQYGDKEGALIWARMLLERKGPFSEGAKYDPDDPDVAEKLIEAGLHPDGGLAKVPLVAHDESTSQQTQE